MIIDYVEYINKLKKIQCYGDVYNKKMKMLEKLYEWEIVQFQSLIGDVGILWED